MIWWDAATYGKHTLNYVTDEGLENIIAIADGDYSMALTEGGSVLAWVDRWDGQEELPVPEELK